MDQDVSEKTPYGGPKMTIEAPSKVHISNVF
jgi:hypothetical protein